MKVVLYARTSRKDPRALETQLDDCRAYARRRGYTVAAELRERGVSGKLPVEDRPKGREMLDLLEKQEAEAVIVDWIGRLAGDTLQFTLLQLQWRELGVELHYAGLGQDELNEIFVSGTRQRRQSSESFG